MSLTLRPNQTWKRQGGEPESRLKSSFTTSHGEMQYRATGGMGMRITKVYTRTGDAGKTRLAGGQQVWKDSLRVASTSSPSLGDVIITFDPSSIGALAGLSSAKTGAPLRQHTNAIPNPIIPIRPIICITTSLFETLNEHRSLPSSAGIFSHLITSHSLAENIETFYFSRWSQSISTDAHRATPILQKIIPNSLASLPGNSTCVGPTATVERGHSNSPHLSLGEWPRLSFTARIGRAQFYRARSASKKDGLADSLFLPSRQLLTV